MINSASAYRQAACMDARSVTTVATGASGAARSRAQTPAMPVSGWNDTIAAGPCALTAPAAARSAARSTVRRSSHMAGRRLVR